MVLLEILRSLVRGGALERPTLVRAVGHAGRRPNSSPAAGLTKARYISLDCCGRTAIIFGSVAR